MFGVFFLDELDGALESGAGASDGVEIGRDPRPFAQSGVGWIGKIEDLFGE